MHYFIMLVLIINQSVKHEIFVAKYHLIPFLKFNQQSPIITT